MQDSYKYFGIPQGNRNHEEAARSGATAKYCTSGEADPEQSAEWQE